MKTVHQEAAETAHSVWLSAHAGSGKTRALVDRVLRLLLEGVEPGGILCITYTRAAATEMQQRIRQQLSGWVRMEAAELHSALSQLLGHPPEQAQLEGARTLLCRLLEDGQGLNIQTIHGFCQSLLSRFPAEAGVAPGFAIAEDRQRRELLEESRRRLLEQALNPEQMPDLVAALERIARHAADSTFSELLQAVIEAHHLFQTLLLAPDGAGNLKRAIYGGLNLSFEADEAGILNAYIAREAESDAALRAAVEQLRRSGKQDRAVAECIATWLASAQSEADFRAYAKAYLTTDGTPKKDHTVRTKSFAGAHPTAADVLLRRQQDIVATAERLNAVKTARFSVALVTMAQALVDIYQEEKRQRSLLDYDDLQFYAVQLLSRPGMCEWVLARLDQSIRHVLIDEAQDTSPPQWQLTRLLVEELFNDADCARTLFVVGDAKQSIYRFQGADMRGFVERRRHYADWFTHSGQSWRELTLETSFRSTPDVLALVDAVCALPEVRAGLGEACPAHRVHRVGAPGMVELWPLIQAPENKVKAPWELDAPLDERLTGPAVLAEQIAAGIRGWLDDERLLQARNRPVRPGDVFILLRRRGQLMHPLLQALRRHGVAVAGVDRIRLNEHMITQDVLALASWCLSPYDDLTLAGVLKSPWFNWDEQRLFELAHARGESSLWEVLPAAERDDLAHIRSQALSLPPFEWLVNRLEGEGMRRAFKRRFGEEADECCDELLQQALLFESTHEPHLAYFLPWLRAAAGDMKREAEPGGDAVRVMTVHGAKGLQAPIVILPDTTSSVSGSPQLLWQENDYGLACYAKPSGVARPEPVRQLEAQEKEAERAESMRQLYVALTRAEDELYITGMQTARQLPADCWYALIERARAMLDESSIHSVSPGARQPA